MVRTSDGGVLFEYKIKKESKVKSKQQRYSRIYKAFENEGLKLERGDMMTVGVGEGWWRGLYIYIYTVSGGADKKKKNQKTIYIKR